MQTTTIAIAILLLLNLAIVLLARWLDRQYYMPFLKSLKKGPMDPAYSPDHPVQMAGELKNGQKNTYVHFFIKYEHR
ncbi:hypothetical protein BDD43_2271 [Mucilaginibacter gracilis]|uniref:Uncharacterized protein n=1 Tax=Mucilaginibacter gracilis TaxID=423350 RepID=A0A495J1B4_9SPHI|nr:hypothetical protein [Mucilaginibacter gracilis]RKR82104.1 hypothetical protein BDD43_2271 [Mucilaginibacter gracilis]